MQQPHAYARRVLVNLALDGSGRRERRRIELRPLASDSEPWTDALAGFADRAELLEALAELPQRQRAVLVLRYFNDLTEAQTAEALGCPPGTVKSSAARGLARLREALQPITQQPRSTET
jgi:RNA polymerase sigma factor (sigma-70 family)